MPATPLVMSKKTFVVVATNERIAKNPEFIPISQEDARRVAADRKFGLVLLQREVENEARKTLEAARAQLAAQEGHAEAPAAPAPAPVPISADPVRDADPSVAQAAASAWGAKREA